ncbi:MAG: NAD(P)-dependent alcohol dehydrogenase [candidate division KSB1 bacterium]|jgi:NADPH:quinone reductase-like Zn-dependent oxidoreductase|nr:NAD(P)-dependent alcohol dehydrogenase [candidate division KSB1 bacterium]
MKAIVQNNYGGPEVLELSEVEEPKIGDQDVLIRVYASAINAGDYFSMRGKPWIVRFSVGMPKPKKYILGWDVAGRIDAVGKEVKQYKPGDDVYGVCSHTFAEYVSASANHIALKPENLNFEETAAVPSAGLTALQELRDVGKLQAGYKVLINGASGGVGTFAVQIAKALRADVTGVCSTANLDMVRSIGADHAIDYTKEDFTHGDRIYDLILDNVGNHSFSEYRRVLKPRGIVIPNTGHGGMGYVLKAAVRSVFIRQQGGLKVTQSNHDDLNILKDLIETGAVKPVIDRTYPYNEIPDAMAYAEQGHVRGKVVIRVQNT